MGFERNKGREIEVIRVRLLWVFFYQGPNITKKKQKKGK
jgi:hypothetical protein